MKNTNKFNVYLSNLAILNINLHNLHWNVNGLQFKQVHEFTEALYDDFNEKLDKVAEIIKMRDEKPLVKLTDYQSNATIKELDKDAFSSLEALQIVLDYLNEMKRLAIEVRALALEEDDFVTVNELEDHVADYNKNIWFIKSMLVK